MPEPTPPVQPILIPSVRGLFKVYESSWRSALARWQKHCAGITEERKALERSRSLVAQVTPRNQPASLHPLPKGTDSDTLHRLDEVKKQAEHCSKTIKMIEQTIAHLAKASLDGKWSHGAIEVAVFKEPRFLAPVLRHIPRGWEFTVLERQGDWLKVDTGNNIVGWVRLSIVSPKLPIEIWQLANAPASPAHQEEEITYFPGRG